GLCGHREGADLAIERIAMDNAVISRLCRGTCAFAEAVDVRRRPPVEVVPDLEGLCRFRGTAGGAPGPHLQSQALFAMGSGLQVAEHSHSLLDELRQGFLFACPDAFDWQLNAI